MAIDPGMMSGIFLGSFGQHEPLVRLAFDQVPGGQGGLAQALTRRFCEYDISNYGPVDVLVVEKFSTRPMNRQYRLEELEPIRIEGMLADRRHDIVWQPPAMMVLRQGQSQAERKRRSDDVLRQSGLWLTGKDVDYKDANDANAAAKHALSYMRSIRHTPTLKHYFQL